MKRKDVWMVCLFLGLFTAMSVSGMAQWRQPGTWYDPGLNLTDEQLAKIQEVRMAFQEKIMPLQMQWQRAQLRLDTLAMKGVAQKDLDSASEALDKIDAELEKAYQAHWNDVRNLLDEKQRVLFDRYGGLGLGLGWGRGMNPKRGMGFGRGYGSAYGPGMGRGLRSGWGTGMGYGFGTGWGRGMGRGFFCPWIRWR